MAYFKPRLRVWWSVYSRHLVEMCPVCFILWALDVRLNRSWGWVRSGASQVPCPSLGMRCCIRVCMLLSCCSAAWYRLSNIGQRSATQGVETTPPAPMNHVKYLRAGPAEMPFRNWYTANTNHFKLTDSVRLKLKAQPDWVIKQVTYDLVRRIRFWKIKISGKWF